MLLCPRRRQISAATGIASWEATARTRIPRISSSQATYAGAKDPAKQGFVMWDAGNYRVESESIVMIQTATDEQQRYRYRLDGDRLTFDDAGCDFAYERDARRMEQ